MNRRPWAALPALSLLMLVCACGGSTDLGGGSAGTTSAAAGGSASASGDRRPAALVVAQGGLGDESYNDLGNSGFKKGLAEAGLTGSPIESQDIVGQGEQILRRAGQSNFGLVVDLEYSHAQVLPQVAADYPKTSWALLNAEAKGSNVASVLFQEQQGSYLAGALAAMMTTDTANQKINPEKIIGVIGGTKSVGIDKFLVGYIQGAQDVDPQVKVLTSYANTFGDPAKGQQLAQSMFDQGADIVYAVAGGTGAGVIQAAKAANRYAIGVDSDQDSLAPGNVLTSMIKRTDVAVQTLVTDYAKGDFPGGQVLNLGLKENGVGLSPFTYTKDQIPAADLTRVDDLKQQIIDGRLQVWNVVDQGYPSFYKG